MPQLPYTPSLIELPVSDLHYGETLVKQKARFKSLYHEQTPEGESSVKIIVIVSPYAASADGDGFGQLLANQVFKSYECPLSADNLTLVDARPEHGGDVLATRPLGQSDAEWQATVDSFEQPTMLQGDFFELLRDTQPVAIGELIRRHIQRADALGRFAS